MIENPILRGFCPDPSILRVGDDYYIATSTFEWWPGVRLFHSRDLAHWEQLPGPIHRPGQMDLRGDPDSAGIWAPCLSWDGHRFYLVVTDVKTRNDRWYNTHNYLLWADNIRGEWSDPVYLNSIGFDPSLFHDTDGKKYLVNMVNGFKGVLVQQVEPETGRLFGERKKVYAGSGLGFTEGPHIYHIGDWYYLLVAEGGTSYEHCETVARAKSVWGPYTTMPDNPLLTSDVSDPSALQKCGHASLVETQQGEWYLAHLCARPRAGHLSVLGRETALQRVVWQQGWPCLAAGGRFGRNTVEEPRGIAAQPMPQPPETDLFDAPVLLPEYHSLRVPADTFATLTARPGWLRLTGQESLTSHHRVSLLAQRQQELWAEATTLMEFSPSCPEQMAGLAHVYDSSHFYLLAKTVTDAGQPVLSLLQCNGGKLTDLIAPVPVPQGGLELRAATDKAGGSTQFCWRTQGGNWHVLEANCPTEILTDEHCIGFTGAHFGMYTHDMAGLGCHVDFDTFTLRYPGRV